MRRVCEPLSLARAPDEAGLISVMPCVCRPGSPDHRPASAVAGHPAAGGRRRLIRTPPEAALGRL